jgi:hypothetical protein
MRLMKNMISAFGDYLINGRVPAASLALFRILFGILILISTIRFMVLGWVEEQYIKPRFHFQYFGFEWLSMPESPAGIYLCFIGLLIASLFCILGLYWRISSILLFILFTYIELWDITFYLNHYYAVSLIAFLLCLMPANAAYSLDSILRPDVSQSEIPAWTVNLLRFQLSIIYIYAGLAKINTEWLLDAMPLSIWLPAHDSLPIIGTLLRLKSSAYIFSWMGMLYDTTIPFFLLWRKTRIPAYIAVILFHIMTGILFQIGVFPIVMIALTIIFFDSSVHARILDFLWPFAQNYTDRQCKRPSAVFSTFLLLYSCFQLLFPWRFILYPGNMFWTEQGYRFGWRVMLMEKAGTALFYVRDQKTGREGLVNNNEWLSPHQEKQMSMQPDMILQYAHFLSKEYTKKGMENPWIRAEVWVTLNGRRSSLLIDSSINLATIQDGWSNKSWIKELP